MDKDPKLRPLYLAQILYERSDEDHYLTTAELMEILEKEHGFKVHRQTIPADVAGRGVVARLLPADLHSQG